MSLIPLLGPRATAIRSGAPLRASQRWSRPIHGYAAHRWFIHRPSRSVFVADGWGVAYRSLAFRRLDLATGEELAAIRTGTSVRVVAWTPGGDELIAATDSRLMRLETLDLREGQRWENRIPRYADSLAIVAGGGSVLLANWRRPSVGIVDLATGSVRIRQGLPTMLIVDRDGGPLLVGGSSAGGLASVDPAGATVTRLADTPPAIDAALDHDGAALWLTMGKRAIEKPSTIGPGDPTRELRLWPLAPSAVPAAFVLPADVRELRLGQHELWLASGAGLVALTVPVGHEPARMWKPPRDHEIEAFDPDERLAVAVQRDVRNQTAIATAFDLG